MYRQQSTAWIWVGLIDVTLAEVIYTSMWSWLQIKKEDLCETKQVLIASSLFAKPAFPLQLESVFMFWRSISLCLLWLTCKCGEFEQLAVQAINIVFLWVIQTSVKQWRAVTCGKFHFIKNAEELRGKKKPDRRVLCGVHLRSATRYFTQKQQVQNTLVHFTHFYEKITVYWKRKQKENSALPSILKACGN